MTEPPKNEPEHIPISQEELNKIFNDGNWEDRLKTLHPEEHHNKPAAMGHVLGTACIGKKFRDDHGLVAIVFYYVKPDGTLSASGKPIPKGLLIDGKWRYVPAK